MPFILFRYYFKIDIIIIFINFKRIKIIHFKEIIIIHNLS